MVLHGSRPAERAQEAIDAVREVSDEGAVSYCQASLMEPEAGATTIVEHATSTFGGLDILGGHSQSTLAKGCTMTPSCL